MSSVAGADSAESHYRHAVTLVADGDYARAANQFLIVFEHYPESNLADGALSRAARLYDDQLGQPQRALTLYRTLLAQYPNRRTARQARTRANYLRVALGTDSASAIAFTEYRTIISGFRRRPVRESLTRMSDLVQTHPEFSQAAAARLWLGRTHEQIGNLAQAGMWYRRVYEQSSDSRVAWQARKAYGDLMMKQGNFSAAAKSYGSLWHSSDPLWHHVAKQSIETLERTRRHRNLAWLARIVVVVFVALCIAIARRHSKSWRTTLCAVVKPPWELVFQLPVACILTLAGLTTNHQIARAVAWMALGSLGVTWLTGATVAVIERHANGRNRHVLTIGVAAAFAAAAVCYLAVAHAELLDWLRETWLFGPQH